MEGTTWESRKRRNSYQDSTLVSFMRKYPKLANSTYHNKAITKQLWGALAKLLNSRGPKRDVFQWRKVWADWKNYVRKKILEKKLPLNSAEKTICEICITGPEKINTNMINELARQTTSERSISSENTISRSSSLTRSTSQTSSRTSSSYSRSLSRSSSPTVSNTSSIQSCSFTPSLSTTHSDKSTQYLSPARRHFHEDTGHVFDSGIMSLPEGEDQSACEKSTDNLKDQFKRQSIALNALVEMLNKNINTQKETLETAKQMSCEIKDLNTNINVFTDKKKEKFAEKEIHNRQMELIYMKRNLLQMELISLKKRSNMLRNI